MKKDFRLFPACGFKIMAARWHICDLRPVQIFWRLRSKGYFHTCHKMWFMVKVESRALLFGAFLDAQYNCQYLYPIRFKGVCILTLENLTRCHYINWYLRTGGNINMNICSKLQVDWSYSLRDIYSEYYEWWWFALEITWRAPFEPRFPF